MVKIPALSNDKLTEVKMPAMFIIMLALFLGAVYYVFWRLWQLMPPTAAGHTVLVACGIIATGCMFVYFLLGNNAPAWLMSATYRTGTSWIIIFLYLLIAVLLVDLGRVTGLIPKELLRGNWTVFFSVLALVAVIMVAGNIVYNNKRRVELNIALDKSTGYDRPIRVVAVSDLHLGYGIGKKEFARWVGMLNGEKPDIVLISGDAIDNTLRPLYEQDMAEIFSMFDAPLGVFAVPGNHEYISGIEESSRFMRDAGVVFLRDSVVLVNDSFYIAGRDDMTNRERITVGELLAGIDRSKPVIMLDHQPYDLDRAAGKGADIQISGHTHRGQVWPASWITDAIFERSHGYLLKDGTHFYISSGLGIWGGKFRIGTRSEYVVINISAK